MTPALCCFAMMTAQSAPADYSTIDSTMKALYASISGPAGPRDWETFKGLFPDEGRLRAVVRTPSGQVRAVEMTAPNYVERNTPYFDKNPFFESEIHRTQQRFGDIANVWSTYASKKTADGEPFERGVNTVQMRYDGKRWWIVSILWQGETAANPLPKEYLPGRHSRAHVP